MQLAKAKPALKAAFSSLEADLDAGSDEEIVVPDDCWAKLVAEMTPQTRMHAPKPCMGGSRPRS